MYRMSFKVWRTSTGTGGQEGISWVASTGGWEASDLSEGIRGGWEASELSVKSPDADLTAAAESPVAHLSQV